MVPLREINFFSSDLYSFDESEADAIDTYKLVCECYERILSHLNLPVLKGWLLLVEVVLTSFCLCPLPDLVPLKQHVAS